MGKVTARLYCHGLGDCNLLGLARPDGTIFWILIDCGIHMSAADGRTKIARVVADIATRVVEGLPPETKPRLDVVVQTHEHWDHNSGFLTSAEAFAAFDVGEVWMAWTENPGDPQARALDKYKGESLAALVGTSQRLRSDASAAALANGIEALLGFNYGAAGERSREARDAVKALAPKCIRYLEPGSVAPLPVELGVTAYVLGPPRDAQLIGIRDSPIDTYGTAASLAAGLALAAGDLEIDDDPGAPFDNTEGASISKLLDPIMIEPRNSDKLAAFLRDHYVGQARSDLMPAVSPTDPDPPTLEQQWRRIDNDWLGSAAELAMQLDDQTNNTSLVLAFDIGGPDAAHQGDVLLFAADAQVGNWRSWAGYVGPDGTVHTGLTFADGTTSPDLIRRTRLYKVGHHGSGNATLRQTGLDAMVHENLTAFIPTDEAMAKKVGWGAIPQPELIERLGQRAAGSVIRSDEVCGKLFVDLQVS